MKLAVVVQRYGADINGGAELHARYVAEHLSQHAEVDVLTTCARDYVTWRDDYPPGTEHGQWRARAPVSSRPRARSCMRSADGPTACSITQHSHLDELKWLDAEGPKSTRAAAASAISADAGYDYVFFFSYRYYHSYHGAKAVPIARYPRADGGAGRSDRPRLVAAHLPRRARADVQQPGRETAHPGGVQQSRRAGRGRRHRFRDSRSQPQAERFRQKYGITGRFALYVGRIDQNKGCKELFPFFLQGLPALPKGLQLVLIGKEMLPIPDHPRIRHLGFLDDQDKFDALAAADLLVMPSYYESLSMVALEAWALGKPVLANGRCEVLRGQCIRSQAGLYYETQAEFAETLRAISESRGLNAAFSANGRRFFQQHYAWPVIEQKYLDILARLKEDDARGVSHARDGSRAGLVREAAQGPAARQRRSRGAAIRTGAELTTPKIHQVLATLGYGDAIGHEVLGIQRVLRGAGFESDIFVQTADPRLEDQTRDYRDLIQESDPSNILIHHFSIGSRASRITYALPDRQILVYHNITPPEFFVDVHEQLVEQCFKGRRELSIYPARVDLALGDSEFNRQELEALGFNPTGVLPVVPDFSHLDLPPNDLIAQEYRRRLDEHPVCRPRSSRTSASKTSSGTSTRISATSTRGRACCSSGLTAASTSISRCCISSPRGSASRTCISPATSPTRSCRRTTTSRMCSCARARTKASAFRSSSRSTSRSRSLPTPQRAVPATMDGAGVLYTTQEPLEVAALIDAVLDDTQLYDRIVQQQEQALARLRAKDFDGTLLRFVDQVLKSPRKPAPPVAWDFWDQVRLAEELFELQQYRPAIFRGLPESPESKTGLVEEKR